MKPEATLFHLYALRALYLLIALAMGAQIWPLMLHPNPAWTLMHGVANAFLAALTLLCLLGVRYPLKMLPLLFYEMAWKLIWLIVIAYPAWRAGPLDADTAETLKACLMVVIVPVVIPWGYVWRTYVVARGDRWTPARPAR